MAAGDRQQQVDAGPLPTVVVDAAFLDVQSAHNTTAASAGDEGESSGAGPQPEHEVNMGGETGPSPLGTESKLKQEILVTPSNKGSEK